MPPPVQTVRQWLERATADLRVASVLQPDGSVAAEAGFHCQQAAEKALKAYLTLA